MLVLDVQTLQSASEWMQALKSERLGSQAPVAILIVDRETRGDSAWSVYRQNTSSGVQWSLRFERRVEGGSLVSWTTPETCPAASAFIAAVERVPLPHVELSSTSNWPRPNPGEVHVRHTLWVSAVDATNAPVGVTLESLGSGPGASLVSAAESLSSCWLSDPTRR
jgi:hypothetical protein